MFSNLLANLPGSCDRYLLTDHRPLLTIIIPSYNSRHTILVCLESIARQIFSDYEIIIQDGFSADGTLSVISDFQKKYPSICVRVFSELDRGVYDAMNKALRHSKGLWIYFLGSDDQLSDPMTLASVCNYLDNDTDVVYGDVFSPFWGGRYAGLFTIDKLFDQNICHQSIFVRNTIFQKFGNFCLDFNVAADWEHNMRWFLDPSSRIVYIDRVIATFADGGLSSTNSDPYFDSIKALLFVFHGRRILSFSRKAGLLRAKLLYCLRRRKIHELLFGLRSIVLIISKRVRFYSP